MQQTGICYIVGGGDFDASRFCPTKEDYIIAADSGLVYIEEAGYEPDLIVGDFDSLGYRPKSENVICHPTEKDDTDMALAAEIALAKGYCRLYIFGAAGGRLDHTLANLQLMTKLCMQGVEVFFLNPDCTVTAIRESTLHFTKEYRGIISVFAASDTAEGVTIKGLKYTLEQAALTGNKALGVSNEFTGEPATISVRNGVLWIVWQENEERSLPERTSIDDEAMPEKSILS